MAMMIPSITALRALRQTLRHLTLSTSTQHPAAMMLPIHQARHSSILADLRDIRTQHTNKKRVGRGPSSGKGKTSGRGHKGQGQRRGKPKNFEGGQTPQWILHPEKGFKNPLKRELSPLNLSTLQLWIDQGRIDPTKPITMKELLDSRAVHGIKDGIKLLARDADHFKTPIDITVSKASQAAIEKIESVGGKILCRFFTKQGVKSITHPHLYPNGHRLANPTARSEIEYYRDPAHRGYLADNVKPGETPSLYWYRKPEEIQKKSEEDIERAKKNRELRKAHAENRIF